MNTNINSDFLKHTFSSLDQVMERMERELDEARSELDLMDAYASDRRLKTAGAYDL